MYLGNREIWFIRLFIIILIYILKEKHNIPKEQSNYPVKIKSANPSQKYEKRRQTAVHKTSKAKQKSEQHETNTKAGRI